MSKLRVCLAEDNHDVRQVLKALLASLGHEVVCDVADGEALVRSAMRTDIDLVIADLDMPHLDGLAAAELIAAQRNVPFILVSGHDDAEHVVLEHEPVTVRLMKPASLASLKDAIQRAMAGGLASG
jgi:two-component system, response regulator PdtaR